MHNDAKSNSTKRPGGVSHWDSVVAPLLKSLVCAVVACSAMTLFGLTKSKGVPSGWVEDFEEAKAKAAKEGKHILMCSVESDYSYGRRLMQQVYSQGKFTGPAKKRFVLMMVDLASDVKNLSPTALKQNSKLKSEFSLYSGYMNIIDCDGVLLKRVERGSDEAYSCWVKLNADTADLPEAEKKDIKPGDKTNNSGASKQSRERRDAQPASRKDGKAARDSKEDTEPVSRIPGTGKSTPAGWMDDFYAAQEIARKENKLIFTVFSGSDWCGWCKVYSEKVLSVPKFIRSVRDRYVLVYIDSPRDEKLLSEKCQEQNKMVKRMLGASGGVPHTIICTADAEKLASISGCNKYAQNGADSFLEYFEGLDSALKLYRDAKTRIGNMNEESPDAVKILHEALVKIDDGVLVANFLDDAEFVVSKDPSLLKFYPYLEYVKPLKTKLQEMQSSLASEAREGSYVDGKYSSQAYSAARRKVFIEKGYRAKFMDLIKEIDAALGKVEKPQTRKALLDLKSSAYGAINSR